MICLKNIIGDLYSLSLQNIILRGKFIIQELFFPFLLSRRAGKG